MLGLAGAHAPAVGVEETEGVVEQGDGLGEGQGDLSGRGVEDAAVPGVGVTESGVRGRGARPADEEEEDQHGAQQRQPLNSPDVPCSPDVPHAHPPAELRALTDPRAVASCGSSVIAPFVP